jgi:hypothetical protein
MQQQLDAAVSASDAALTAMAQADASLAGSAAPSSGDVTMGVTRIDPTVAPILAQLQRQMAIARDDKVFLHAQTNQNACVGCSCSCLLSLNLPLPSRPQSCSHSLSLFCLHRSGANTIQTVTIPEMTSPVERAWLEQLRLDVESLNRFGVPPRTGHGTVFERQFDAISALFSLLLPSFISFSLFNC